MAIKMNERSVKWQLCYDVTARTWWMVSEVLFVYAFILVSSQLMTSERREANSAKGQV